MESPREWYERKETEYGIIISLFLAAFLFYFSIFLKNPLITGIDGPYYLIQVRSLLNSGHLVYGDPPLIFYLLAFFTILLRDITLGVEFGVALFCALSTIPIYFLMKRVTEKPWFGYIAILLFIFSALFIRMMSDFMKNAIGIFFLISFFYYLHDMAFNGRCWMNFLLTILFLFLTGLTHILDFGVALLFLIVYSSMFAIFGVNRSRFLKSIGLIALIFALFVVITVTILQFFFTDYNKILHFFEDIAEIQDLGPLAPLIIPPLQGPLLPISWLMLASIIFLGFALSIYEWRMKKREPFILVSTITITGMLLSFPLIPMQWLFRFMLMDFIPIAVILSHGLSKIEELAVRLKIKSPLSKALLALISTFLCLSPFVVQSVDMAASVRPTISYAGYLDLMDMKRIIPTDSIVVVPGFIQYWAQYVDEVDIANRLSEGFWQSYSNVLGLFFKQRLPPFIGDLKIIFVGRVFVLAEYPPRPPST